MRKLERCPTCKGEGVIDLESRERMSQGVLREVASEWLVSVIDLVSRSKRLPLVEARIDAAKRLHQMGMNQKEIGFILNRDRTTILYHLRRAG